MELTLAKLGFITTVIVSGYYYYIYWVQMSYLRFAQTGTFWAILFLFWALIFNIEDSLFNEPFSIGLPKRKRKKGRPRKKQKWSDE